MGSWVERTLSKVSEYVGEVGLSDQETKDSKPLAIKFYGGCEGWRNSQSHRRVHWKMGLEQSDCAALFPL